MFGFIEIITGAKAVVPLVPGVIKIVEKLNEEERDPTLAQILQQTRLDTLEGALNLRNELIEMLQDETIHVQLAVPLKRIGNDLSWLTTLLRSGAFRNTAIESTNSIVILRIQLMIWLQSSPACKKLTISATPMSRLKQFVTSLTSSCSSNLHSAT
jgi:hypothetical protein